MVCDGSSSILADSAIRSELPEAGNSMVATELGSAAAAGLEMIVLMPMRLKLRICTCRCRSSGELLTGGQALAAMRPGPGACHGESPIIRMSARK
jgi:hypothetical protein